MNVNNLGIYEPYQLKIFLNVLESIIRNSNSGYFSLNDKENIFRIEIIQVDKKGNPINGL